MKEKSTEKNVGFTCFTTKCLQCPMLSNREYRLKKVLDSHFGPNTSVVVKIETLAEEMGKSPRSVSRVIDLLIEKTNLDKKRFFNKYEFYLADDKIVYLGKTPVTHIRCHNCPLHIKRYIKTKSLKISKINNKSFKKEIKLTEEESLLLGKIVDWLYRGYFDGLRPPEESKLHIGLAIKRHGLKKINELFDKHANCLKPSARGFFSALKVLNYWSRK